MPLPRTQTILMMIGAYCKDPSQEEEFNRWYDKTHIPEMKRAVPGILSVKRYQSAEADDGGPNYLAIFELKDEKALADFTSLRERQQRGEVHAFTAGPPHDIVLMKAYKPI